MYDRARINLISEIAPRFWTLLTNWPWMLGGISFAFLSLLLTALRWHADPAQRERITVNCPQAQEPG